MIEATKQCNTCAHDGKHHTETPCNACGLGVRGLGVPAAITLNWEPKPPASSTPEHTGGSVSYYQVKITNSTSGADVYTAECNDIIEALDMNFAEGNAFKALWRRAAARTLGKHKAGNNALYDAEKVVFFGQRLVEQEKAK